jgi:hypothetical protein|tara:strand:+ start:13381 stop:13647 length:267 start_codon:yes stop_codon:yes gene_type:complete
MDNFEMKKEIEHSLNSGLCQVTFTKKDGTERTLTGTLNRDLIPADKLPSGDSSNRIVNEEVRSLYETDLDAWRSFRWDSVISYNDGKI